MNILKNLLHTLHNIQRYFRMRLNRLRESSEDFFRRISDPEEDVTDIKYLAITYQITQDDLDRIVIEKSELESLFFDGIDISSLDLSVLTELKSLKRIGFKGTKFDKTFLKNMPPSVVSYWFEDIDFSENPVILPYPESLETTNFRNCTNISGIENLDKIGGRLSIVNSCIDSIPLVFPNLQRFAIKFSQSTGREIETLEKIGKGCPNLRELLLWKLQIEKFDFVNTEGIIFQHLEFLCICDSPKFTEFGNVEGMFPNLVYLDCSRTNLNSIQNISKFFPNLKGADFRYNAALTDITPLLDYDRGFTNKIHLDCSGINENMEPVIEKLREFGTTVTIDYSPLEKSRNTRLASQVILPKGPTYNGIKVLFFYGTGESVPENLDEVEITQLDLERIGTLYKPDVSPIDLRYLIEFPTIAEKITELRIIIPEDFGSNKDDQEQETDDTKRDESYVQIVKDLDALEKSKSNNKRTVAFDITKIPELSEKDKNVLSARCDLTFVYKVPISVRYPTLMHKNLNYLQRLGSDEVNDIRTMLNELLEGKQDGTTVQEKVGTIFSIMQENFSIIQERSNNILKALKSKRVTPEIYICIANELLKSLGISKMQNGISLNDHRLLEPEISVPISNEKYIVLYGFRGVTEKKNVYLKMILELFVIMMIYKFIL